MPDVTKSQQPKLLDDFRTVLRRHRPAMLPKDPSVDWLVRVGRFPTMRSRQVHFSLPA
jgi:hypothetical protein